MVKEMHFEPHVRMLWWNRVDVIAKDPGTNQSEKMGSFVTYGKIMSFVMRFFFGVEFEKIELNGRIHFVRPKELERFKQSIPAKDNPTMAPLFDQLIKLVKVALQQEKPDDAANGAQGDSEVLIDAANAITKSLASEDPLPAGWERHKAQQSMKVPYRGVLIPIPQGDNYYTFQGKIAIGWHGTHNPPCDMT